MFIFCWVKMKFSDLYNKTLINIELNIFDDDKIYEKLCKLYVNNVENNDLLINTIKEYDLKPESRWKRKFINTLLKLLLDNELLCEEISIEIICLIYQKINKILWNDEVKWEYLEFGVFFRLSPKEEDVIKLEEKFDLKYYLYGFFLRYYFSKKNYDKFCKSLEIYFNKYFSNTDSDKIFILGDGDYESWFKIKEIANTFLGYFLENLDELINLIYNYQIHPESIELLCRNASNDLVKNFLKLLFNEYFNKHNYYLETHIKDEQIERLVETQNNDSEFWKYIFDKVSSWEFQPFRLWFYILKWIITGSNIKEFFSYSWENYIILNLYYLYDTKDKIGQKIYRKYKKIIDDNKKINDKHRVLQEKNELKKEKELRTKINLLIKENAQNKRGIYPCREIIYLYNDYPNLFTTREIKFVKNEIESYFSCNEINLRGTGSEVIQQGDSSFRIPRFLRDLVLCVKLSEKVWVNLWKYTDLLISLIPYLFESELNIILNILLKFWISELWNDDINWLINIYLNNLHKNLSIFHNTRIPYLISKWFINFSNLNNQQKKEIYKIYINKLEDDTNVQFWEKKIFLESILQIKSFDKDWLYNEYNNISQQFVCYNYYEDYLLRNIDIDLIERYEKFLIFNEILITLYKNEDCIKWRLNQLKWIKTDYIREGGEVRWLTKRDDEIFRSNSKDERFYACIIQTIVYPDYISDIKEILWIAQNFDINEGSYIRQYIYDFTLEYFKKIPNKKLLDEALLIDDEIFVKRYLLNIMDEIDKNKFREIEFQKLYLNVKEKHENIDKLKKENQELIAQNGRLLEENDSLNKLLERYRQLFNKDEFVIFLYVEWRTDKYYIDQAKKHLKKFENLKIEVINCCWSNEILNTICSYVLNLKKWIHIWLFDFDYWWISARSIKNHDSIFWKEKKYKNFWRQQFFDEKIFVNECNISNDSYYGLILIPIQKNYVNQIFFDSKLHNKIIDKQWDNPAITTLKENGVIYNKFSYPLLTIEHLLWDYFSKYCKEVETFWGMKLKIIDDKKKEDLLNDIDKNINTIPQYIWDNFSPIFDYIQLVYSQFKSNFK